jgi:hypothetical protein
MSLKGEIYLGQLGSEILISAIGRKFTVDNVETARSRRAADGTLKKDILYVKKNFNLDYSIITGNDLAVLEGIYSQSRPLSLKVFTTDTLFDIYVVSMTPSKKTRLILLSDGLWSGVSFKLEEV